MEKYLTLRDVKLHLMSEKFEEKTFYDIVTNKV
jgi:hypothetical protein